MKSNSEKGLLFIVSGPAGSGKGTVVGEVRKRLPDIGFSVSATTREPRVGEISGVHYHYVGRDDFLGKIENGEVLEYTEYCGNYYGTLKSEVESVLSAGRDLILDIEVEGATQIKRKMPEAICIMLLPPDKNILEKRLRGRGTETDEVIEKRLQRARRELEYLPIYDYVLVNGTGEAEKCADDFISVISAEHRKSLRQKSFVENFFED